MKLLSVLFIIFTLASCNQGENTNKNTSTTETINNGVIQENPGQEILEIGEVEITEIEKQFLKLEKNISQLSKIKNSDFEIFEIEQINQQIERLFVDTVNQEVIINDDITLCEKLDWNTLVSCKKEYIYNKVISEWKSDKCNLFTEEIDINSCKNNLSTHLAFSQLDIKLCESITDSWNEIQECKNEIFKKIALKNSDINQCNNIISEEDFIQEDCRISVEQEIEYKEFEKQIQLEEEERNNNL